MKSMTTAKSKVKKSTPIIYTAIFLSIFILFSCKKTNNDHYSHFDNSPSQLKVVTPSLVRVNAVPHLAGDMKPYTLNTSMLKKLSAVGDFGGPLTISNAIGNTFGLVHINGDRFWDDDKAGRTLDGLADEQVILPETALDIIYPGSMLKGNSIGDQSSIVPVNPDYYNPKPIEISATIAAKKIYGRISPDFSSFENFKQATLAQQVPSEQNMSLQVDIKTFMDYNELKYMFGSDAKVNTLFFSNTSGSNNDVHKISKTTGLVMKYTQENFSIDISTPEPGELYENLNPAGLNGVSPVYVSTIKYGRMGILVGESEKSAEETRNAFQSAFNAFGLVGGSKTVTEEERSIINETKMKVYLAGVKSADAVKVINGFEELVVLINNGKFSKDAPGVPISFKMRYLTNHQIVKTPFQINIPFEDIYLTLNKVQSGDIYNFVLSAYADKLGKTPLMLPSKIKIELSQISVSREGSPREGFTVYRSETPFSFYNNKQMRPVIASISKDRQPGVFFVGFHIRPAINYKIIP